MKGYQQPNLSTNRSVCAMFVIGLCNWTVSVICACCCSAFCRVKCFFPHENVYLMASIFLKICHSFDQLVTGPHLIQLCETVLIINKSDSDITRMILQTELDSTHFITTTNDTTPQNLKSLHPLLYWLITLTLHKFKNISCKSLTLHLPSKGIPSIKYSTPLLDKH